MITPMVRSYINRTNCKNVKKQTVNLELYYFPIISFPFQGNDKHERERERERDLKENLHTTLPNHQITWDIDITAREKNPIRKPGAPLSRPWCPGLA
jgi:hypothetical protein